MLILNSPAPSESQETGDGIDDDAIFDLFRNSGGVSDSSTAGLNDSCDEVPTAVIAIDNAVPLSQLASEMRRTTSEGRIFELLDLVSRHAMERESQDIAN